MPVSFLLGVFCLLIFYLLWNYAAARAPGGVSPTKPAQNWLQSPQIRKWLWTLAVLGIGSVLLLRGKFLFGAPFLLAGLLGLTLPSNAKRTRQAPPSRKSDGKMTRAEAAAILGVSLQSSPEEIIAAYRRLALRLHPDNGGSSQLMQEITQARDLLLR